MWWAALVLGKGQGKGLKFQAQHPVRGRELRCRQRRAQPYVAAPTPTERCRIPDPTLNPGLWVEAPRTGVGADPIGFWAFLSSGRI